MRGRIGSALRRGSAPGGAAKRRSVLLRSFALGAGSAVVAAGLAGWLTDVAGPDAARPVAGLGSIALVVLVATLALGRSEPVVIALVLLGAAYAAILVIDDPPLDGHSVIVGGAMLAVGELAFLSVETRSAVTAEAGAVARRVASVAMLVLLTLGVGATVLAVVDLLRTGGLAIEAVGVAAAAGAVGLLVLAARDARSQDQ